MPKSGFIAVLGRTNAGKSSLINYLLNTKIAMVSHKQNATRRLLKAIVMDGDNQLIFTDTPGLNNSQKAMNKILNERALLASQGSDAILFCASVFDDTSVYEKFLEMNSSLPHVVAITKIDLAKKEQLFAKLREYAKYSEHFSAIVPVSTKKAVFKRELLSEISKILPEAPHYYDSENLSDAMAKDIYREFILEAIFECVSEELPYSAEVRVKNVSEGDMLRIEALIITDNTSHKGIFISALKNIGIRARKLISALSGQKVYLGLEVVVEKNWLKDEKKLMKFID